MRWLRAVVIGVTMGRMARTSSAFAPSEVDPQGTRRVLTTEFVYATAQVWILRFWNTETPPGLEIGEEHVQKLGSFQGDDALQRYAGRLRADRGAVRSGFSLPWSGD